MGANTYACANTGVYTCMRETVSRYVLSVILPNFQYLDMFFLSYFLTFSI